MVIIDGLDVERECKEYLERIIENLDNGKLSFVGHKYQLYVRDVDSFHKIAQATENKEINEVHGGLYYIVDVPRKERGLSNHWTVSLDSDENNKFLWNRNLKWNKILNLEKKNSLSEERIWKN